MTKEELKEIVTRFIEAGGKRKEFAELIDVSRVTLWRWMEGKEEIPSWLPDVIEKRIKI